MTGVRDTGSETEERGRGINANLVERIERMERLVGTVRSGVRFWILTDGGESLDYDGPFSSQLAAMQSPYYRPQFGCVIAAVPFEVAFDTCIQSGQAFLCPSKEGIDS